MSQKQKVLQTRRYVSRFALPSQVELTFALVKMDLLFANKVNPRHFQREAQRHRDELAAENMEKQTGAALEIEDTPTRA